MNNSRVLCLYEKCVKIVFHNTHSGTPVYWKECHPDVSKPDSQSSICHLLSGRYQKSHVISMCFSCFMRKKRKLTFNNISLNNNSHHYMNTFMGQTVSRPLHRNCHTTQFSQQPCTRDCHLHFAGSGKRLREMKEHSRDCTACY